ncbi:MAG: hypothetical protein Q4A66_09860 [Eubacteriales bacterium]|nr:hypothetical protein [Eubacteriales bacterium]
MQVRVVGGDARFRHAAEHLRRMGYDARWQGNEPPEGAQVVLAPEEGAISGEGYDLAIVQKGRGERKRTVYLEADEEFLEENAFLTAEGALLPAMGNAGRSLFGARCLIIGYGRIARALYGMLAGMRAEPTAAVRPGRSTERAEKEKADHLPVDAALGEIERYDHIWNTAPERIVGREVLQRIRPEALLIDLASAPYGFDLQEAQWQGVHALRLGGLPGKYCPVSAGAVLARAAARVIKRREEEGEC